MVDHLVFQADFASSLGQQSFVLFAGADVFFHFAGTAGQVLRDLDVARLAASGVRASALDLDVLLVRTQWAFAFDVVFFAVAGVRTFPLDLDVLLEGAQRAFAFDVVFLLEAAKYGHMD